MTDLQAFREDVRHWLETRVPESLRGKTAKKFGDGVWGGRKQHWEPDRREYMDAMLERGWTAPTWPEKYGGGGLTSRQARLIESERKRLELPRPLIGFGLAMIGPTLLDYGNEEQKQQHLPKIVRGEIRWCQGYSEPNAGSDLASLQTRAERDGDEFVINGQKVWTSYADVSDWIFSLVRTSKESKHGGITFLLIDMDSPGISTSPISLISGASPFCEVFFEDVRVPVENVVNGIGNGWAVAKALLGHERSMIGEVFGAEMTAGGGPDALVAMAKRYLGTNEDGEIADPVLRDEIARITMEWRAFGITMKRFRDLAKAGYRPGAESSFFKVAGTELNQRRRDLAVRIAGPNGLGWEGPGFTEEELGLTREWLRSRANTIEGGTSEVQLNIIAKRVLNLPD